MVKRAIIQVSDAIRGGVTKKNGKIWDNVPIWVDPPPSDIWDIFEFETFLKYQSSGAGGIRSPPATPHRLQNPKWPPGAPKMVDGVWKEVQP